MVGDRREVGWLHLTDLHVGAPEGHLWSNVNYRFFGDLPIVHRETGPWNFIFFTGDLVYSGKHPQFRDFEETVRKPLIDKICELPGQAAAPVFLAVPGNHDLDRCVVKGDARALARAYPTDPDVRTEFWDGRQSGLRRAVHDALGEWDAWWQGCSDDLDLRRGRLPGDYSGTFGVNGLEVAVMSLNSTFLQLEGGAKEGKLAVAAVQADELTGGRGVQAWVHDHDVSFLLTHQPPGWLFRGALRDLRREIAGPGWFSLHLYGHQHVGAVSTEAVAVGLPRGVVLGRSLFGMPKFDGGKREHGYSAGRMTLYGDGELRADIWLRAERELPDGGGRELGQDPAQSLDPRTQRPVPQVLRPGDRAARARTGDPSVPAGSDRATRPPPPSADLLEQRYRDWLLGVCDRLDIRRYFDPDAPLPIDRDSVAIDTLYVPLNVIRDPPPRPEVGETRNASDPQDEDARSQPTDTKRDPVHAAAQIVPPSAPGRGDARMGRVSFGNILRDRRHVVVVGRGGAGKSTLVRWASTALLLTPDRQAVGRTIRGAQALPDADLLPIVVELKRLQAAPVTIRDALSFVDWMLQRSQAEREVITDHLVALWEGGRAVVFFDGVDEIGMGLPESARSALRDGFCSWLGEFGAGYREAFIVATSKPSHHPQASPIADFEHVRLEFTVTDKEEFAQSWAELFQPDDLVRRRIDSKTLAHGFRQHEQLTSTPQLTMYVAAFWQQHRRFPGSLRELYDERIDTFSTTKSRVISDGEWRQQLHYLAFAVCDGGRIDSEQLGNLRGLMREDLKQKLGPIDRHTPEEFLALLADEADIITVIGQRRLSSGEQVPEYEFHHPTSAEFLAGRGIAARQFPGAGERTAGDEVARLVQTEIATSPAGMAGELPLSSRWVEAVRAAVQCSERPDELLRAMISDGDEGAQPNPRRARCILAALCLASEPAVGGALAAEVLTAFASSVDHRDGILVRPASTLNETTEELAGSRWALPLAGHLIAQLERRPSDDLEGLGNVCAVVAARLTGPETTSPEELESWLRERAAQLRSGDEVDIVLACLAVMNVAYEGGLWWVTRDFVDLLYGLLERGRVVAFAASWALWWLSRIGAWHPLASDVDTAVELLERKATDPAVGQFLLVMLADWDAERALGLARLAIERGGAVMIPAAIRVLDQLQPDYAYDLVSALLDHSSTRVVAATVSLLGRLGDPSAVPALIATLQASKHSNVRTRCAHALGELGAAEATCALIESLADEQAASVRLESAWALGQIGDTRAFGPLAARAQDAAEDHEVRGAAIDAMMEVQNRELGQHD